ncbi:nucleotidyltransferase family protein [Jannaschia ovalis]|uniref:Nucleotidyltransferase family protein n=1 Tax=Jannaschia ovalis TaxID=3038773 RepID=A0ABY8LB75_9RHOB|nr:nucleotidyltransferase family protein [Jannaschia sp. GRR-S6-38]WGH78544.1 nucleotidyltransferase family protein [Jannaschia sp. GRR-S6-38]
MRPAPAILILAAGAATRMRGADKLLEEVDGTPLILRAARAACAVSPEVLIALPAEDRSRRAWLGDSPARLIDVDDRAMSASIRAGVAACRSDALLIHLADMPEIGAAELQAVSDAWRAGTAPILRATAADGTPGQPVVFDRALYPELRALEGDAGAKPLLPRHPVERVALPGRAALTDLDTPEDWAAWRARR